MGVLERWLWRTADRSDYVVVRGGSVMGVTREQRLEKRIGPE